MTYFYGWRIVAACMLVNFFGNALGLFGVGVYLKALSDARGWPVGQLSGGITLFLVVSAVLMVRNRSSSWARARWPRACSASASPGRLPTPGSPLR
jgi:hypothetical protein